MKTRTKGIPADQTDKVMQKKKTILPPDTYENAGRGCSSQQQNARPETAHLYMKLRTKNEYYHYPHS